MTIEQVSTKINIQYFINVNMCTDLALSFLRNQAWQILYDTS